jgi:signal transduction histidine kinase/DNA-binding response OmpR family regulator/HAMP domain-containing protein
VGDWNLKLDAINDLIDDLVRPTTEIARVMDAVADGDLSQKMALEIGGQPVKGEFLRIGTTVNTMVDQLSSFADEVTRVAREVGTEGKLGGQAEVKGVSGTWRDLTENVNQLAGNLTSQVRNIAQVTTAVATGDLSQKITVEARGEVASLKDTINRMVEQLSSFADEVTRVAKEVGTEGKLGGQAEVEGVSGTWRRLTENVNQLAGNLTTQVRAIADVSTAVTQGDLTRQITVEAQGEVAQLKDRINQMIANLRDTTTQNAEQDWLKTNLARISGALQGQRDLGAVSRLIMSEVTPLVGGQHGAFFLDGGDDELRLVASYGYQKRKNLANRFSRGEGLVGQAALEGKSILVSQAPPDYVKVTSGLGESLPVNLVVLPVLFEDQTLAVIELASVTQMSELHLSFLEQLAESIGVVLSNIVANRRTEELLEESQRLAEELQSQQDELKRSNQELEAQAQSLKASEELLQTQQEELRQTNEELQDKAALLSRQNRDIEEKNAEIERAREALEERAAQLALSSKYKSEFLANMSHELRTPLNSLLILSKLLADNGEGNLGPKQIEFAETIHTAGTDLLSLISDILDLSKVEAGKMEVSPGHVPVTEVVDAVERGFRTMAEQKGLELSIEIAEGAPPALFTDEQRLQQVLRNLLSNAVKFTDKGGVELRIDQTDAVGFDGTPYAVAFSVIDTGIGIADDKLRLIFEAFQQADGTTSRRYGGTGLGLSISREIARLLGGEIRVRSVPGEGSTFTLLLPATFVAQPQLPSNGAGDGLDTFSDELSDAIAAAVGTEAAAEAVAPAAPGNGGAALNASEPAAAATAPAIPDDRDRIAPGDRVVLVLADAQEEAELAQAVVGERGLKTVVGLGQAGAVTLAHEHPADAVLLLGGAGMLTQLQGHPRTRHLPVWVATEAAGRHAALQAGAAGVIERPLDRDGLMQAVAGVEELLDRATKRVLVVEDDDVERGAVVELIGGEDVEVVAVASGEEAVAAMDAPGVFDCVVLDLKLPGGDGFSLLERIKDDERHRDVPVIIHTGKPLTRREETRLKRFADAIVVKDAVSPERLLDETALRLHRPAAMLPAEQRRMLEGLHEADGVLEGRKVLIVDDDVRNVFALTSVLEARGMSVVFAENGREGLEALEANPDVDLMLLDVMMPEMDGYETARAIRAKPEFGQLPIISLTAKAMQGDREASIASGASDYVTKPVDTDQLLSLMRVWLYR